MGRPRRVLCVEDRPDHAELVGALLHVINLPGLDGMAATRLLRSHPDTAHIPVLALTAYAIPGERQKILAAGCAAIVSKPMDLPSFLATLDALLANSKTPVPVP